MTLPSRVPPMVAYCSWLRPWPMFIIDSLRVSRQRTGRPSAFEIGPSSISSAYVPIFAPNAPPTSGVITRTWSASTPFAAAIGALTPWACWVDSHWWRRPSTQVAAEPRTSNGHGATRWLRKRPVTTTSQSLKYSSVSVFSGMPSDGRVEDGVRAGRLVDQGLGRHRRFDVDQGGEEVDVDEHHLGGVGGLRERLGDDRNDRFTDEADLVAGEHRARHGGVELRRHRLEPQRLGGEHADDAGHVLDPVDVDRQDRAVGDRRARVHHVQGAAEQVVLEVVDVHAAGGEELGVFLALNSGPQDAAGHVCPLVV